MVFCPIPYSFCAGGSIVTEKPISRVVALMFTGIASPPLPGTALMELYLVVFPRITG